MNSIDEKRVQSINYFGKEDEDDGLQYFNNR